MDVKTLDTHSPFSASLSIVSSLVSVRCSSNPAIVNRKNPNRDYSSQSLIVMCSAWLC